MTNLLASIIVTVVTNITTTPVIDHYQQGPCPEGLIGCCVMHGGAPVYSKTERRRLTEVKRLTVCKFDWNGKAREIVDEEVLSSVSQTERKSEDWIAGPLRTNAAPNWGEYLCFTNSSHWSLNVITNLQFPR